MKREEELTYVKVLYKCLDCENVFEDLRLGGDFMSFAPVPVFCESCNYQAAVDYKYPEDDGIAAKISYELDRDEFYKQFKNKGGINPGYIEFSRQFCETCDPCPKCGRELSLLSGHKCPKCSSKNLREMEELGLIKIKAPWVTHNKMKNKQANVNQ